MAGIEPATYALRKLLDGQLDPSERFSLNASDTDNLPDLAGKFKLELKEICQEIAAAFLRQVDRSFDYCCRSLADSRRGEWRK